MQFEDKFFKASHRHRFAHKALFAGFTGAVLFSPDQCKKDENLFAMENALIKDHADDIHTLPLPAAIKKYPVDKENYKVIFVLGGPGVGKGTQCALLSKQYGWIHMSAGDLLRREQSRKESPFEQLIATCIREGNIVPHFVTIALLKAEIELYPPGAIFLVDGFPREVGQAQAFEETVLPMELVLFFECEEDVMLKRLMQRSKSSDRTDDNIESIMKRFRTYQQSSLPVIAYYEESDRVKRIPCTGSQDEVFSLTIQALKGSPLLDFTSSPVDTVFSNK